MLCICTSTLQKRLQLFSKTVSAYGRPGLSDTLAMSSKPTGLPLKKLVRLAKELNP